MKTKFTIYCVLLALVYVCNCCIILDKSDIEHQEQYNDGYKAGYEHTGFPISVPYTMTKTNTSVTNDSVYNKKSGTMLPAKSDSFEVKIQSDYASLDILHSLLLVFIPIYAIIIFIKFFISVYKDNVFDSKTENRVRILGIIQIVMYVLNYIYEVLIVNKANSTVDIEGFCINNSGYNDDKSLLYIGFILLILSEVFRMARRLKEEQELTI